MTNDNRINWRQAVLNALNRYSERHGTKMVTREALIDEELDTIVREAESVGITPAQTLSRVLQELRDENVLFFQGDGRYLLLDAPINAEDEDWPDDAIDFAVEMNKLKLGVVPTDNKTAVTRRRKGRERVRKLTLINYKHQCAMCDVRDIDILVASHISMWKDDVDGRGDLTNVLSLCRVHDPLFEYGYISLSDRYEILIKDRIESQFIQFIIEKTDDFRPPLQWNPAPGYLAKHRARTGFS